MALLLLVGLARAATPVVVDGPAPPQLLAELSALTGLPTEQLQVQALEPLLAAPPQALGDAVVRRCTGEATRTDQVQTELVRASAAWSGGQDEVGTQDHLDLAVAYLGCLGELADAPVAAQVFLLRGALEARRGDGDPLILKPQSRMFSNPPTETNEAAIRTVLDGQLYLVLGKQEPSGRWQLRMWWKPFVTLIWLGGALIAFGGLLALVGLFRRDRFSRRGRAEA